MLDAGAACVATAHTSCLLCLPLGPDGARDRQTSTAGRLPILARRGLVPDVQRGPITILATCIQSELYQRCGSGNSLCDSMHGAEQHAHLFMAF